MVVGAILGDIADLSVVRDPNPQTGETIKIKAAKLPKFKPGKAFKEAL